MRAERGTRTARPPVFEEFEQSGLDLRSLPGNTAKLRLILDLAASLRERGRLRVLDVGCAGPQPLNVWEPFAPLFESLELVGVDVAGLDRAEERARELGLRVELLEASAMALADHVAGGFDAVVSTQVLEHLRDWRRGIAQMAGSLAEGGTLYLTCDSGELRRPLAHRVWLVGKRVYARLPVQPGRWSGDWERGQTLDDLAEESRANGLAVERLERYALHDVKEAQRHAGTETRRLWLALEETLADESTAPVDTGLYGILYLRARRTTKGRSDPVS